MSFEIEEEEKAQSSLRTPNMDKNKNIESAVKPAHSKTWIILGCILIIGVIIRSLVLYHSCQPGVLYPTMDEMNYRELAENILDHKVYSTWSEGFLTRSTRAPIYPVMIASGYAVSNSTDFCIPKILNFVFDISIILLVFLVGRKLFGIKTGLLSAGIYSLFGHAPYFMQISSPHTLAVMLLLLVSLSFLYIKKNYWVTVPVFAIIYAILIHTRPVFLVSLPFLLPALFIQLSDRDEDKPRFKWLLDSWKQKLIKSIIPIAIIAILCLPWGIRNYRHHKSIVPVCTIAGWHLASNINFDMELSIKYLTDEFYNPERRGYSEADYYNLGKSKFLESIRDYHVEIPAFGFARLIYGWSPPMKPPYRFVLPKAYIFPIYITNTIFIPLPDFEGMIYITIFATLAALYFLRKKIKTSFADVFYKGRGIWVIILGYALVHIIGIPLIAYRFLIEPLLIVFGVALLVNYIRQIRGKEHDDPHDTSKADLIVIYSSAVVLLVLISVPLLHPGNSKTVDYQKISGEGITYEQLRDLQWKDLGDIPDNTRVTVQGIAKYLHKGFKYVEDDYYAEKCDNFAAGRLYVEYGKKNSPLGIGDVRLNFHREIVLPENGDPVIVTGKAKTGPFKEIIIDVEEILTTEDTEKKE